MADAGGIPDPTDPATAPSGTVTPAVPAILPQTPVSRFPASPAYAGATTPVGGNLATSILQEMKAKYGLQDYVPQRLTPYTTAPLAPLGPDDPQYKPPGMGEGDPGADRFGGPVMGPQNLGEAIDWTLKPWSPGMLGGSMQRSLNQGFMGSLYGAAVSWYEMNKAIGTVVDPNYDPFKDGNIQAAGFGNQMSMFYGSQSAQQSQWLIEHIREQQRDAEWMNKSGPAAKTFGFLGGVLGDPSNLLPGDLGIKGAVLLNRIREGTLSGPLLRGLASKPALYGALIDGARSMGLQFAVGTAENALANQLDPTLPGDLSSDLVLPSVIAGSVGLLTGLRSRLAARKLALEVQDPTFLKPEGPPQSGFEGRPYGIRAAVEKIPEPLKEKAKDAAKDQAVEALDEGQPLPAKHPSNGGSFPAGSLATDYGPMRKAEHQASPATAGFHEPVVHSAEGGRGFIETSGGALPPSPPPGRKLRAGELAEQPAMDLAREFHEATGKRLADVEFRTGDPIAEARQMMEDARAGKSLEPEGTTYPAGPTGEGAHQPGSVGAQLSPESLAYQHSVLLAQGRLAPTGIGLEHLPLNPIARAFQGASVAAMRFASDIASTGGLITKANKEGIANLPPVETMYAMRWNKRLVDSLRYMQDQWSAYRTKVATGAGIDPKDVSIDGRSDWRRISEQVGTALKDRSAPGEQPLSYAQFRQRVAEALNKGDADEVSDAASPYVNAATRDQRASLYDYSKNRAVETGVFDEVHEKALYKAQSELRAVEKEADDIAKRSKREGWDATRTRQAEEALIARTEDAKFKLNQMQKKLDDLRDNGPMLNGTAPSYRPRLWDTGALISKEKEFFDRVVPWFQSAAGGSLDQTEAVRITKNIHELISHQNPIYDRGDMADIFNSVAGPGSAHARSFTIPDELVRNFLVNDAEVLARYHIQQMGRAIEFKERFGNLDGAEQIAEIEQDYRRQIIEANKGATEATPEAIRLTAQMKTAITDAQALRDKYYGTYGASPDPHRWDARTIRVAKQFNNLSLLGLSGLSALSDLIRPLMTGRTRRLLRSWPAQPDQRKPQLDPAHEQAGARARGQRHGTAAQRARQRHGRHRRRLRQPLEKFEHGLNQANAWMFVANGLNAVNQIDKEWAHRSIGGRVNNILLASAAEDLGGGGIRIPEADRARFAAAGIGEAEARRIGLQLKIHGVDFGNITMANTTAWRDDYARDVYRSAMNQFVNRTVPTPGIGDTPNWLSTPWGGLIGQYKAFGMGALVRGAYSGLQEGGNRFWYGAAAAVGFGILLNEVRSQLAYGKTTFDKPAPALIVDGIDRSGVLGWFNDVNKAIETLSGHRVGVKPMLGAQNPVTPTLPQVAGTLGGPTAGQAARVVSVANDLVSGHPTAQTMNNWRSLVPGNTLPYARPAFDAAFGSSSYRARPTALAAQGKATP